MVEPFKPQNFIFHKELQTKNNNQVRIEKMMNMNQYIISPSPKNLYDLLQFIFKNEKEIKFKLI